MTTWRYDVTPHPKVRMTRRDTWATKAVRPSVQRWRAFQNRVQELGITVQDGDSICFFVPMPASWKHSKRREHLHQPHRSKPDLDNLLGGLFDAAMPEEDKHIACLGRVSKVWAPDGMITITRGDVDT